jgi:hypothetical protein
MSAESQQTLVTPDHRALLAHLDSAEFLSGVRTGRWRLVSLAWPVAMVAVSAAPRDQGPSEYVLRIDLSGYPQQAPTASPWDLAADAVLGASGRPTGEFVSVVFRSDWESGRALYAPYDRVALIGHPNWAEQHPADVWTPVRTLSFFLDRVHVLLSDEEYQGAS